MASQFFGLNIAYTGLLASNAALNTTSNNIANVHTEGYSRQQVIQQASGALRVFQTYGCAGAGVDTLAVERIRDEFYDSKFWSNNTLRGEYSIKQYYMQQIEDYFADDGTKTGFRTIFNQMMTTGLQALLKNPSDVPTKEQFIGYAGSLVEYFNGMAGSLEKVQKDVNQEIKLKVDQVNSISSEIAALNKQINVIEMNGSMANELRDRRAVLLDQLSEIVSIETTEIPMTDVNNPEHETGANRFIVKIAGGQLLVDTSDFKQLECVARTNDEKVNQTDIEGLYDVYWSDGQEFNLYNNRLGGALQALVELRDGNNSENFKGTVTGTGTMVDDSNVTHDTVTVKVSKSYLQDLNKCNLSEAGGKINLGNQIYYYDSWSYTCTYPYAKDNDGNIIYENGNPTYDMTAEPEYSYTFVLSGSELNDRKLTNDRVGKTASVGADISYQGIPYYMNQMNEWVRTFAQKFNDILTTGYDGYDHQGSLLFTGSYPDGQEEYDFPAGSRYDNQTTGSLTVDCSDDSYYQLTAKNFSILNAMLEDADLLATRRDEGDGVEQNDLLEEIKKLATDKDAMSYRGSSASEFLERILSDVGLNAGNAETFYKNYSNITNSVNNQRIAISGVDEDEEAVNLVKYQNAYNLASKMVQTLTEVYDRLILQTGV